MGQSAKGRRLCCSITLAQPARRREKAGKIYPPAIQSSASVQRMQVIKHMVLLEAGAQSA